MIRLLPHLSTLSRQQVVSLSQSSCVSSVELTDGRGGGGGAVKSCDGEKAFYSTNHPILSYTVYYFRWLLSIVLALGKPWCHDGIRALTAPHSSDWEINSQQPHRKGIILYRVPECLSRRLNGPPNPLPPQARESPPPTLVPGGETHSLAGDGVGGPIRRLDRNSGTLWSRIPLGTSQRNA
jgi:hypothetical protein